MGTTDVAPLGETAPAPPIGGRRLLRLWTLSVTAGESTGFLVPAAVGVVTADRAAAIAVPCLLAAGAVEGAILGWAQSHVLRRAVPSLDSTRWVGLTAGGAAVAYLLGLSMAFLGGLGGWPAALAIAAAGVLLLSSLGGAQWVELRHHVPHAGRWVVWTAIAWSGGLTVFFAIAPPLWHPGQSLAAGIAIGAVAGVAMAGVQAALTGWGLLRLLQLPGSPRGGRRRTPARTDRAT